MCDVVITKDKLKVICNEVVSSTPCFEGCRLIVLHLLLSLLLGAVLDVVQKSSAKALTGHPAKDTALRLCTLPLETCISRWPHAHMQVGVKGQTPVLNGELHDQVKPEDCFWNISDGKLVEITLQKASSRQHHCVTSCIYVTAACCNASPGIAADR